MSSLELEMLAKQEFDLSYGPALESLEFESSIYEHFRDEFFAGAELGVMQEDLTRDFVIFEKELRQLASPFTHTQALAGETSLASASAYSFACGICWGFAFAHNG